MLNGVNRVVVIIQARMNSSRLRGKIMANIEDHPMLYHIVERAKAIREVNEVVIATTVGKSDDVVLEWARANKCEAFRGSEEDVLKRFFDAASKYKADIIIRICADSPLFDPGLTSEMVRTIIKSDGDFVVLKNNQPSLNGGVNVFSFRSLKKASENASKPYQREHVIPYLVENRKMFKIVPVAQYPKFIRNDLRLTVDTYSDLKLVREIYKHLYKIGELVELGDVIKLLDKNPTILKINSHVKSIGPGRPGFRILIMVASNQRIGYGHLFRMLNLAKTLTEQFANGVEFLIDGDVFAKDLIFKNYFRFTTVSLGNLQNFPWSKFNAVVIDSHEDKLIRLFRKINNKVLGVSYDNKKNSKFADVSFAPIDQKVEGVYSGLKYLILGHRQNISLTKPDINNNKVRKYLLISFGAADPKNYTLKIAQMLLDWGVSIPIALLIGPFYKHRETLSRFKKNYPKVKVLENVNLDHVFSQTKIAICYFGVTMFEMISSGIVCGVTSVNEHQLESVKFLRKSGVFFDLGMVD
ncbi:MAG: hypothetical protein Q8O88_05020, partial [bacterium]|nr:hypothetical protein [bacterium]